MVETVVLSLYFIVPFVDVNLHQKVTVNYLAEGTRVIQHEGMDVAQFFSFFQNIFRTLDYKSYTGKAAAPSMLLMTVFVIAIIMWIRKKANMEMKLTVVLSFLMLLFSTNIFPWDAISDISRLGNLLAQVQFPWRYLGMGTLFLSLLAGYIIKQFESEQTAKKLQLAFVILGIVGVSIFTSNYIDDAKTVNYMDTASMDADNVGIYEYILGGTDWTNLSGDVITDNVESLDIDRKGSSIHMDITTTGDASILLPVQNYYGYKATDGSGNAIAIENGENNNLLISLPSDWSGSVDVTVGFWTWTLVLIISIIAFIAVIIYFIIQSRNNLSDNSR